MYSCMTTYIAIQLTTSGKALLISARQSRTFCIHFNNIAPKGTTMGIAFKFSSRSNKETQHRRKWDVSTVLMCIWQRSLINISYELNNIFQFQLFNMFFLKYLNIVFKWYENYYILILFKYPTSFFGNRIWLCKLCKERSFPNYDVTLIN